VAPAEILTSQARVYAFFYAEFYGCVSRGSRSFGTKSVDPLEVIVFTGFLESLS